MLESYKLYKNNRNRFVSLEQEDGWDYYKVYMIGRRGTHKFIKFIDVKDESKYVGDLKLQEATEVEYALNALYRISPEMERQGW